MCWPIQSWFLKLYFSYFFRTMLVFNHNQSFCHFLVGHTLLVQTSCHLIQFIYSFFFDNRPSKFLVFEPIKLFVTNIDCFSSWTETLNTRWVNLILVGNVEVSNHLSLAQYKEFDCIVILIIVLFKELALGLFCF